MWKLLRNLGLAAALIAGALKLLLWYAVKQEAERLTLTLAPYAQVQYDSISAGLNGAVGLNSVKVAIKREGGSDIFAAEHAVLETPGALWLLRHTLLGDDTLPPRFGINFQNLKLPGSGMSVPGIGPEWLSPLSYVPFETLGCGVVTHLSLADYQQMGLNVGDRSLHGEYHYDSEAGTLSLALALSNPPLSSIALAAELNHFEPGALAGKAASIEKLRVEQLSFEYSDSGYLHRRNHFCAQHTAQADSQFVEQHIAAVQGFLKQRYIEPGAELLRLYRRLVESGGQITILSLPGNGFIPVQVATYAPEDLLRQLNVTTRFNDAPPIMFRLSFIAPPTPVVAEAPEATDAAPAATPAAPGTTTVVSVAPTIPQPLSSAPSSTTATEKSGAPAPAPAPAPVPALTNIAKPNVNAASTSVTSSPTAGSVPVGASKAPSSLLPDNKPRAANTATATVAPTTGSGGVNPKDPPHPRVSPADMFSFDKAEAAFLPRKTEQDQPKPPALTPSAPPPPPGSTLALVWEGPKIDRLPPAPEKPRDYDVIEYAAIGAHLGKFVRVITDGGKNVDGYVVGVDETGVEVRVNGIGGSAQFVIPKLRILQIQLPHRIPAG